jgi:hypothetical protein
MRSKAKAYYDKPKRKSEERAEEDNKRRVTEGYSPAFIIGMKGVPLNRLGVSINWLPRLLRLLRLLQLSLVNCLKTPLLDVKTKWVEFFNLAQAKAKAHK